MDTTNKLAEEAEDRAGVVKRLQSSVDWMLKGMHTGPCVSVLDYQRIIGWLSSEPMDMALCEIHSVVIRPGQLYTFNKVGDCEKCATMAREAAEAYGPATDRPLARHMLATPSADQATQPAEAVADTFERYAAIREGHYNGIVNEYFQAREGWTLVPRGIFKDAFYRGFDARDSLSASPAPASASEPETVPWPTVTAYPGGAAEGGPYRWLDVRLTDGPETTRFVRASASVAGAGEALSDKALNRLWAIHDNPLTLMRAVIEADRDLSAARQPCHVNVQLAYGYLWHVNEEPMAPVAMLSPAQAANKARQYLLGLLTKEEQKTAIEAVRGLMGGKDD